jgi:alpha-L-fucosidase
VAALLGRYFDAVPDGVVNDRWGVPYHGVLTREYTDIPDIIPQPWESTRGLGYSFGFNQDEDARHSLSGAALIRLLVDVVAKNGNLLINVGPAADGSIPELQRTAMRELGAWLQSNGDAIYGTRPWIRMGEPVGAPVRYTQAGSVVHVHALDPTAGEFVLAPELRSAALRWADGSGATAVGRGGESVVVIPDALRSTPVAVLSADTR